LLYGTDPAAPAETGLSVSSKGVFTFASGQKFPGTGTVKSVGLSAPSSEFTVTGSPITGSGTLALAWTVPPDINPTANSIVKRDGKGNQGEISIDSSSGGVSIETSSGNSTSIIATSDSNRAVSAGSNSYIGIQANTNAPLLPALYSFNGGGSETGIHLLGKVGVGAFGDASTGYGVLGTTDNGYGGVFENNTNSTIAALYAENFGGGTLFVATAPTGRGCSINSGGTISCTGANQQIVPLDNGKRKVAVSSVASPGNWFEDFGSASLAKGSAVVILDRDFVQTVNTQREYMVFPVANGDCKGLYVASKSATSFEVRELGGGTSNVRFDYRIVALRRDYENVRFEDHTRDPDPRPAAEKEPLVSRPLMHPLPLK
jgi:hypothetical protein